MQDLLKEIQSALSTMNTEQRVVIAKVLGLGKSIEKAFLGLEKQSLLKADLFIIDGALRLRIFPACQEHTRGFWASRIQIRQLMTSWRRLLSLRSSRNGELVWNSWSLLVLNYRGEYNTAGADG